MVKKILLVSTIAALASANIAMANPAPYVGASIGITSNTSNIKLNGRTINIAGGNYRGMPINLFAGYGGVISQNFYLAGEAFVTPGTISLNNNNGLKTSYNYGVAIIPGVMLSDNTLAYVRAGILKAKFSSANGTRTGGQFGVGLQTTLTQNIDTRLEYDYVAYRSITATSAPNKLTISPRADQVSAALIYKFD